MKKFLSAIFIAIVLPIFAKEMSDWEHPKIETYLNTSLWPQQKYFYHTPQIRYGFIPNRHSRQDYSFICYQIADFQRM